MKNILSPLTGCDNVTKIDSFEVEQICMEWQRQFGMDVRAEFHGYQQIDLYRCADTGIGFFHPVDICGSPNLYVTLQSFDWYYMQSKWEHQVALMDMTECRKVLEIGAANGAFVQAGLDSGIETFGIEINYEAVSAAKRKGIPVSLLSLEEAAKEYQGRFDGVCSFQVLEHVVDPKSFISDAVSCLKPGGILILSVPNADSFLKHAVGLLDMPPHHVTKWRLKTFQALEAMFPVKLEKIRFEPLAEYHENCFFRVNSKYYQTKKIYGRFLINQFTRPILKRLIHVPMLRRMLTGHTLYAVFRKTY